MPDKKDDKIPAIYGLKLNIGLITFGLMFLIVSIVGVTIVFRMRAVIKTNWSNTVYHLESTCPVWFGIL